MEVTKRVKKAAKELEADAAKVLYSNNRIPMILTLVLFVLAVIISACVAANKSAPWMLVSAYWLLVATKYAFDYAKLEENNDNDDE